MNNALKISRMSALGVVALLAASSVRAATITDSPSAPTGAAISATDESGTLNATQDFTNDGGPPGQTFTAIGATPTLTSFTFKGGNSTTGGVSTFVFQVGSVDANGIITQLENDTVTLGAAAGASDYLTFRPSAPINLTPGGTYEVSVLTLAGAGTYGLARSSGSPDAYGGGTAFNNDKTTSDAGNTATHYTFNGVVSPRAYDYVFYVNATPTPEPGSLCMVGLGAVGFLARRRRMA